MARPDESVSPSSSRWTYLIRFLVDRNGDVRCSIRDIVGGAAWVVADPDQARAALRSLESTRPHAHAANDGDET
jgi:hypothetical protein